MGLKYARIHCLATLRDTSRPHAIELTGTSMTPCHAALAARSSQSQRIVGGTVDFTRWTHTCVHRWSPQTVANASALV